MSRIARPLSWMLGVCLLLASVGCTSGVERSNEWATTIQLGMSAAEVRNELGEPDQSIKGDPGTPTTWLYHYEGGPSAGAIVLLAVFFIVLVVVLVLAGGGGGANFGNGGEEGPPGLLRIRFDGEGRVMEIVSEASER